jgi:site-specific recombinase XerD
VALPYVHSYRDRHGRLRHYLRRAGHRKVPLPADLHSPEFLAAYQDAMARPAASRISIGAARHAPDSVARWVALYLESATFAALAPDTRRTRRNILERFRVRHGDKRATMLRQGDIERIIGSLSPVVARNFLKALRPWLKWCAAQGLRGDNPAADVERPAVRSTGYNTWPEEHIVAFRARHPLGTTARLALELLVSTGAARADVVRLGRQHVQGGILSFRRHKTGVLVEIPVLPEIAAILAALPQRNGQLTYLLNEYGRPFSDAGFGNWFRERCNEAGIPVGYSAHGIRKYAATLRANRGATAHELMAWFGWLSIREAERYTRNAERRRLAIGLAQRLGSAT